MVTSHNKSKYLFSYRHDGSEWMFEVEASSEADARARVAKMAYATLEGETVAKVPATLGLIPRLIVSMQNTLSLLTQRG